MKARLLSKWVKGLTTTGISWRERETGMSRLWKFYVTPKGTLTSLLLIIAVSLFIGEIGIFYIHSWDWFWPEIRPSKNSLSQMTKKKPLGGMRISPSASLRYHYDSGDAHYYTAASEGARQKEVEVLLRVLILSDPHIMCTYDKEELLIPRWDSDRYLASGYSRLLARLDPPDIIVFLGDLFSDGFHASPKHWEDYMECFDAIFPRPSVETTRLFLLGDNDIGGEGPDLMTEETLALARKAFGSLNNLTTVKGVKFAKLATSCFINRITRTKAENQCKGELKKFLSEFGSEHPTSLHDSILPRIALSHVPNFPDASTVLWSSVELQRQFDYVISGHIHHEWYASYSVWDRAQGKPVVTRLIHEITVPTCSYRMGEAHPGAGAMVIGSNGDVAYRVLWLPPRYPFFALYVVELVILLLVVCCLRHTRRYRTFK